MNIPNVEDRPKGPEVPTAPVLHPYPMILEGHFVTAVPLALSHAGDLFEAIGGSEKVALWDYMLTGPYPIFQPFHDHVARNALSSDLCFFTVLDKTTGKAIGYFSLMSIDPENRSIEIGHVIFSPKLQRTPAATEVIYLVTRAVFENFGYRRYVWKCNNLNAPSKRAAERLGFTAEGVFRQHMICKGRNRDTAWFSMLDIEWPTVKSAFEAWLDPSNFDEQGQQRTGLAALRERLLSF